MKKLCPSILSLMLLLSSICFTGCSAEFVDISLFTMPTKIVYEIGEGFNSDGLLIKAIKTDSAVVKLNNNSIEFNGFDSTTSGKKTIIAKYEKFSTSFDVYVAHKILTTQSDFQTEINSAADNNVIKISKGEYAVGTCTDIAIEKPLIIIGEDKNKTILHGNFLIGENTSFENVIVKNLTFKLNNTIQNQTINFEGEYTASKNLAALHTFSTKAVNITNCNFSGYPFAILCTNVNGLIVTNNLFDGLYLGGIKTLNSTKNAIITKNCFINIASNILCATEDDTQEYLATVMLAFNKSEVAGVTIYDNAITKVALKGGNWIKFNTNANALLNANIQLSAYSYVNNTASILLYSTGGDNLPLFGVTVSKNSFGNALNNLLYGLGREQNVNANSVLFSY